jgi:hypothetical protein
MRKLEIWCKIYLGHLLVAAFPGLKLLGLAWLSMDHPLT